MAKTVSKREVGRQNNRCDRCGRRVKRGDWVRVIGLPNGLKDDGDTKTKTIFALCRGRVFRVIGFYGPRGDEFDGLTEDWIHLQVGRVVGERAYAHSIWIEPQLVEVVQPQVRSSATKQRVLPKPR
jgi:hypothetical protein